MKLENIDVALRQDSFGFRLTETFEHRKLTVKSVSAALGLSRTAVHKWTKGGEISYENLRSLAKLLDVNWIWLRYGDEALSSAQAAEPIDHPVTNLRRSYIAEIMRSEELMRSALEATGIVAWEWNLVADDLIFSSSTTMIFGRELSSMADFRQSIPEADLATIECMYATGIDSNSVFEYAHPVRQPDKSVRWVKSSSKIVRDASRRPVKIIGVSRRGEVAG
ncbi:helix-turn-helix domain-containing protein [Pseudomonas sp. CC120222-01a]|uniref:helix-turn-helix domain-containing protein n=1 Tax=Pseudomonas sp. CC120222-01a TaxID=1378075 RepID=UPI0013050819|nr:helix-turn-helix domain-containing protein [Pseudomonas sp. CC120222-01a]